MPATSGFTLITGSQIYGSLLGQLLTSGQIQFTAVSTSTGSNISFEVGGGGGQMVIKPFSFPIVNGVITADSSGIAPQLPDVSLTNPRNIGYAVQILDPLTGKNILGPGYVIQPTGPTFDFDSYTPALGAQVTIQVGPTGPTGPAGPTGAASTVPGPTGPVGPTGPTGDVNSAQLSRAVTAIMSPGRNVLDPSKQTVGNIRSDGTLANDYGNNMIYGPYFIGGATSLVCDFGVQGNGDGSSASFFDINDNFISNTEAQAIALGPPYTIPANTSIPVPAGAVWFRVCNGNGWRMTGSTIWTGTALPPAFVAFGSVDSGTMTAAISAATSSVPTAVANAALALNNWQIPLSYLDPTRQLLDPTTLVQFQTLNGLGVVEAGGNNQWASPFIYIGDLTHISTSFGNGVFGDGGSTSFYDINKQFVGKNTVNETGLLTVPSGAVFVRFVADTFNGLACSANGGSTFLAQQFPTWTNISNADTAITNAAYPFRGAKVFIFGDSIAFSGQYQATMMAAFQAASYNMDGGSGLGTYQFFRNAVATNTANPAISVIQAIANEIAGASLIFIAGGGNDGSTSVGSPSDPPSPLNGTTSLYGDYQMVANAIEAAIALNAPAVMPTIIAVTPYLQVTGRLPELPNIIAVQQAVYGGMYGYPVLVAATKSGINLQNLSVTTVDGIHPSAIGGKMLGGAMARFAVANAHQ